MNQISCEECLLSSDDDSVDFPRATSISKDTTRRPGHSSSRIYRDPRCSTNETAFTEPNFGDQLEGSSFISASANYSPHKSKLSPHYASACASRKTIANGKKLKPTDCIKNIGYPGYAESDGSVVSLQEHHRHLKDFSREMRTSVVKSSVTDMIEAGSCSHEAGETIISLLETIDANPELEASFCDLAHELSACKADLSFAAERIKEHEEDNTRLQTEVVRLALQPCGPLSSSEGVSAYDIFRATREAQKVIDLRRTVSVLQENSQRFRQVRAEMEQTIRDKQAGIKELEDRIAVLQETQHSLILKTESLQAEIVERDEQLRRADHDKLACHESALREKEDRIRLLEETLARRDAVRTVDAAVDAAQQALDLGVRSSPRDAALAAAVEAAQAAAALEARAAATAAAAQLSGVEQDRDRLAAEARDLASLAANVSTALALVEAKAMVLDTLLSDLATRLRNGAQLRDTAGAPIRHPTAGPTVVPGPAAAPLQRTDGLKFAAEGSAAVSADRPAQLGAVLTPWAQHRRRGRLGSGRFAVPTIIADIQLVDDGDCAAPSSDGAMTACSALTPKDSQCVKCSYCSAAQLKESESGGACYSPDVPVRFDDGGIGGGAEPAQTPDAAASLHGYQELLPAVMPLASTGSEIPPAIASAAQHRGGETQQQAPDVAADEQLLQSRFAAAALPDGSQFLGQWSTSGEPEGAGILQFAGGDVYTGRVRGGLPHGRGIHAASDGGMYQGEWGVGHRHGHGVEAEADGSRFAGAWVGGARHGVGIASGGSSSVGANRAVIEYWHGREVQHRNFPLSGEPGHEEVMIMLRAAKLAARAAAKEATSAQELCALCSTRPDK